MLLVVAMVPMLTLTGFRLQLSRPDYNPARLPASVLVSFVYTGVLPLNFGMALAAVSFASEFESGTIIPLLASPAHTAHIFSGKLIAALAAAIGLAWFSQGLLLSLFGPVVGRPWPLGASTTAWSAAVVPILVFPLVTLAMVLGSRARSAKAAQVNGTLAFLAVLAIVLLLSWRRPPITPALVGAAAAAWIIAGFGLLGVGIRRWDREELLG